MDAKKEFNNALEAKGLNFNILNSLKMANSFANIERGEKTTKFSYTDKFFNIENYELPNGALFAFELFTFTFKSLRNAIHCTLKTIAERREFTEKIYSNQSNISYLKITAEQKKIKNFNNLLATLSEEDKEYFFKISERRMRDFGYFENQFDFFYISNGKEKLTEGQTISIIDNLSGFAQIFKIFQISPNGFITLIDKQGGFFTLTNFSFSQMQTKINIDATLERELQNSYEKNLEEIRIDREEAYDKAFKAFEKAKEREEKEAKKIAEAKKKAEEKEAMAKARAEEEAKNQKAKTSKTITTARAKKKTEEQEPKQEAKPTARPRKPRKSKELTEEQKAILDAVLVRD